MWSTLTICLVVGAVLVAAGGIVAAVVLMTGSGGDGNTMSGSTTMESTSLRGSASLTGGRARVVGSAWHSGDDGMVTTPDNVSGKVMSAPLRVQPRQ